MTRKTVRVAAALAALVLIAQSGCTREEGAPAPEQSVGYAGVALSLVPDPPVALRETAITAAITDNEGGPLTGAEVVFDLSMPGMYHGENRVDAAEGEPGVYGAKGIFTMGGRWLVKVEVAAPGVRVTRSFYAVAEGG